MSDDKSIEALLSRYVDGELNAEETARVEKLLAEDESARATVAAFREADAALADGLPMRTEAEWSRLEARVSDAIDAEQAKDAEAAAASGAPADDARPTTPRARNWRLALLGVLSTATVLTLVWQSREGTLFPGQEPETEIAMKEESSRLTADDLAGRSTLGYSAEPEGTLRDSHGSTPEATDRLDSGVREQLEALGYLGDSPAPVPAPAAPNRTEPPRERIEEPLAANPLPELAMDETADDAMDIAADNVADNAPKATGAWGRTKSLQRGAPSNVEAAPPSAADLLRRAHEARDRGENETSARLYRAAADAATDADVRMNARFGLVDLNATLARASRAEADLREAAALVREFLDAYGDRTIARGAVQQGLFVWAELTALPGADCTEARRLIEAWQVGQEVIQKSVNDAVQAIERNCADR